MADLTTAAGLARQYSDPEKFLVRVETHRKYSTATGSLIGWVTDQAAIAPGHRVLDVGCGPGTYHGAIIARGGRVIACDLFPGMLRDVLARHPAPGIAAVRGSAERIPLAGASCDRVFANHMLYHVADQPAALREMRRVLKPGGRVVLATNGAKYVSVLVDLHVQACEQVGLRPRREGGPERFTLDHLDLVRSVFPGARVVIRDDEFVFPETEPVLRFYASFLVEYVLDAPADGSHRAPLIAAMRDLVDAVIAREGVLRVPKRTGCFVADV